MIIELNYTNDELTTLLDGLNNALFSLRRDYVALMLGCQDGIPKELLSLRINEEDLKNRLEAVKELYKHLLIYENS